MLIEDMNIDRNENSEKKWIFLLQVRGKKFFHER